MQRTTLVTLSLLLLTASTNEEGEAGNAVHVKSPRASSRVIKRGAVILVHVRVLGRRVDLEQPAQTFVCKNGAVRQVAINRSRRDEKKDIQSGSSSSCTKCFNCQVVLAAASSRRL